MSIIITKFCDITYMTLITNMTVWGWTDRVIQTLNINMFDAIKTLLYLLSRSQIVNVYLCILTSYFLHLHIFICWVNSWAYAVICCLLLLSRCFECHKKHKFFWETEWVTLWFPICISVNQRIYYMVIYIHRYPDMLFKSTALNTDITAC